MTKSSTFRILLRIAGCCLLLLALHQARARASSEARSHTMEAGQPVLKAVGGPRLQVAKAGQKKKAKSHRGSAEKSTTEGTAKSTTTNLNTATAPELEGLPGIGPKKAAAIVQWRSKHGPFRRVVDLRRVKGFGPKTLASLRPLISVR